MADSDLGRVDGWVREYGESLLPVARSFATDPDDVEDILQEIWLIALRRQHTLPEGANARAWLYQIALNVGRGRIRKRTRRGELLSQWWKPPASDPSGEPSPSIEGEQLRSLLWREISRLPGLQREVVVLRVVEGMSTAEAAEALDRAEGTIKACLHRALKKLEERLGGYPVDWAHPIR